MPDTLTTITKLINSPPGQLAAGGVLAGVVWKFFERVEAVLTERTKLEIAVWLLGVKVGQKVEPWPDSFIKVFDRVFGTKHLTWRCFWRSAVISIGAVCFVGTIWAVARPWQFIQYIDLWTVRRSRFVSQSLWYVAYTIFINVIPDYLSLIKTRKLIGLVQKGHHVALVLLVDLAADIVAGISAIICCIATILAISSFIPVNRSVQETGLAGVLQEVVQFTASYTASPSFAVCFIPPFSPPSGSGCMPVPASS